MRLGVLAVAVLGLCSTACFVAVTEGDSGSDAGTGGSFDGGVGAMCETDTDCRLGLQCYRCGQALLGQCVQGCGGARTCPSGQLCRDVSPSCTGCPCADAICEGPACDDPDGDGYVESAGCESAPGGDCAPNDPQRSPARGERCANGLDDDCDGLVDQEDPQCAGVVCLRPGFEACFTRWNCGSDTLLCNGEGCCMDCPPPSPTECTPGYCLLPMTVDPYTGCAGSLCLRCPVTSCPDVDAPVCAGLSTGGSSPRTFRNECQAESFNGVLVHEGPCLPGEGYSCGAGNGPDCGPETELYCRRLCPTCDQPARVCTKKGVCFEDSDCPAGLTPPPTRSCLDGSTSELRCVAHACVQVCP